MGQQQLLLLVLGIVIVGIAAVAGIQAFSEGKASAKADATVADASRAITDIQAWYFKPKPFGGGGEDTTSFEGFKWSNIGRNAADDAGSVDTKYETANACMTIAGVSGKATVTIETRDADGCGTATYATAVVKGGDPEDVTWTYN